MLFVMNPFAIGNALSLNVLSLSVSQFVKIQDANLKLKIAVIVNQARLEASPHFFSSKPNLTQVVVDAIKINKFELFINKKFSSKIQFFKQYFSLFFFCFIYIIKYKIPNIFMLTFINPSNFRQVILLSTLSEKPVLIEGIREFEDIPGI